MKPDHRDRCEEPGVVSYYGICFTPAIEPGEQGGYDYIWSRLHRQWIYAIPGGGFGTAPQCREAAERMARKIK